MRLEVRASVPNMDAAAFRKVAEATKEGCPISQVMKGNVPIELDAKLT
jgi:osmotically inducible protein OsmC